MKTRILIVYGSFTEPTHKRNFFLLRIPCGRIPWKKKIVPQIDKLIKAWLTYPLTRWTWDTDAADFVKPWDELTTLAARYEWTPEGGLVPANG